VAHRTRRNQIKATRRKLRNAFARELQYTSYPVLSTMVSNYRKAGMKDNDIITVLNLYELERSKSKILNY